VQQCRVWHGGSACPHSDYVAACVAPSKRAWGARKFPQAIPEGLRNPRGNCLWGVHSCRDSQLGAGLRLHPHPRQGRLAAPTRPKAQGGIECRRIPAPSGGAWPRQRVLTRAVALGCAAEGVRCSAAAAAAADGAFCACCDVCASDLCVCVQAPRQRAAPAPPAFCSRTIKASLDELLASQMWK